MRFWKSSAEPGPGFDPNTTRSYQVRMKRAPAWLCPFLAGNHREQRRFRDELRMMRGAWPLLMKQRRGGTWTPDDKARLKAMVRSASRVSPYLFIWALPGSVVLLPFLAWFHLQAQLQARAGSIPTMKDMIAEGRTRWQFRFHLAACGLLTVGLFWPSLAHAGGLMLALSALLLEINLLSAVRRFFRHSGHFT